MRSLRTSWFPFCLGIITCLLVLRDFLPGAPSPPKLLSQTYREGEEWEPPHEDEIPSGPEGARIRYGKELITNTAAYLGPQGSVAAITNGTNCQNCHTYGGMQNFGNPFSAVASTYPRFRERSGHLESVEFRINDCLQRSLNGYPLDSLSVEMQAMVAYINWVGKDVPKTLRPFGAGTESLPLLNRAADSKKGAVIYQTACRRCHGTEGEGERAADGTGYVYPPLWGENSYNTGAGLYRLSLLAGFVKNNMPYGANWKTPQLRNEEAWDVAAFIASQPRPVKIFAGDYRDRSKKPFDYPFGPYADSFSQMQHEYGPFGPIKKADAKNAPLSSPSFLK